MNQVLDFFRKLFDASDWPPRWNCGNCSGFDGWLYIISDLLIWSAYFTLPLIFLKYITRKAYPRFIRTYFLFAVFILAGGSTYLLDAITFWYPAYRLNAIVRFITGVISWITVFYLVKLLPVALTLKSHREWEYEMKEKERSEEALKSLNAQLNEAEEIAKMGHWEWHIISNKVSWSGGLFKIYGLAPKEEGLVYENILNEVHPEDKNFVHRTVQEAIINKELPLYTYRIVLRDGSIRTLQGKGEIITDNNGKVVKIIGTAQDITNPYKAQQQLLEKTHELEATNTELKKFAFIASHDLQEPLRKILTFSSLLQAEASSHLNQKSLMYMDKIVSSSSRMQKLIDDILQFSSLRADADSFKPVDMNAIIQHTLSDMEIMISETGAQVQVQNLPVIEAIPFQMGQLFQNLVSNAIKFRKADKHPTVQISAEVMSAGELFVHDDDVKANMDHQGHWQRERIVRITITDNGIGFDESYKEKIFEIFQRLHSNKL
jgi:PAS domain S-box-containing protein